MWPGHLPGCRSLGGVTVPWGWRSQPSSLPVISRNWQANLQASACKAPAQMLSWKRRGPQACGGRLGCFEKLQTQKRYHSTHKSENNGRESAVYAMIRFQEIITRKTTTAITCSFLVSSAGDEPWFFMWPAQVLESAQQETAVYSFLTKCLYI